MHKILVTLLALGGILNIALAETTASHCVSNESTLFSCNLNNRKIVSLCATKKTPSDSGYLQYRFGELGRIEIAIPKKKSGIPNLLLVHSKDKYLEYNKVAIVNEPLAYNIESFRQFKKINKDGYPTTKSSDSLNVEDSGKSVWEGNKVYSSNCSTLVTPIDAKAIAKITGIKVEVVM